jgi:DNA polymerase I
MKKTLHLIDGAGYLFRAFHGLPKLSNKLGEPTGALFGVVNMLRKYLKEEKPEHIAFVFDASGPTFREAMYPLYKANRPPMPEDLRAQIAPLLELVEALGFPMLRVSGVEADDVIATLCLRAQAQGMGVQISTGDKDLCQLVNEQVRWINTMTNERLDAAGVLQKHGVRPDQIIDYLALMGDSVDNIPGVEKCGPKTAAKWLAEYQTLDGVIANADKITGKIGEYLRAAIPQLPLSKALASVKTDVELAWQPEQLSMAEPAIDALKVLYARYGFSSALKEIGGGAADLPALAEAVSSIAVPADVAKHYELVLTESQLEEWITRIKATAVFAFDTETTGLDPHHAEIVGISLASAPGVACYIPLQHDFPGAPQQLSVTTVMDRLRPVMQDPNQIKVGHHGKFDMHILARYGVGVAGYQHDSMLQSYVLNSTASAHNMDDLAAKYLKYTTIKYQDVTGKGVKQISFSQVAFDDALRYAAEDADITLRLHLTLYPHLQAQPSLLAIYQDMEMPLVPVLQTMEKAGIRVDGDELRRQSQQLAHDMLKLEQSAHELAGRHFSLDSPKQLQQLLFDELKLPAKVKTPTGQPSTNEDALDEIRDLHPLPALILEYRGLAKLKSTYTDKLAELADHESRVHTSFHQAVAATGRLSSTDPNLQNIPIRTTEGKRVRRAFVAPDGYQILAADYSQIELRIMAHLSDDPGLLQAFASGIDVHRATAGEIFGVAPDQVSSDQRRAAKAINFGLIYGMSAFGLAKNLGIGRDTARDYVERYFQRYPGVKRYMEATRQQAHNDGFVETVFGRRLYLPELASKSYNLRQAAERQAINAPMQGTAADIIKRAMIDLHSWLVGKQDQIRMLLQVHDELVFEIQDGSVSEFQEGIRSRMSNAATLKVPLVVDIGVGRTWFDAHG